MAFYLPLKKTKQNNIFQPGADFVFRIPLKATPVAASVYRKTAAFAFLLKLNFVCPSHVWKEGGGERDRRQARQWGEVVTVILLLTPQHVSARHKGRLLGGRIQRQNKDANIASIDDVYSVFT